MNHLKQWLSSLTIRRLPYSIEDYSFITFMNLILHLFHFKKFIRCDNRLSNCTETSMYILVPAHLGRVYLADILGGYFLRRVTLCGHICHLSLISSAEATVPEAATKEAAAASAEEEAPANKAWGVMICIVCLNWVCPATIDFCFMLLNCAIAQPPFYCNEWIISIVPCILHMVIPFFWKGCKSIFPKKIHLSDGKSMP